MYSRPLSLLMIDIRNGLYIPLFGCGNRTFVCVEFEYFHLNEIHHPTCRYVRTLLLLLL